MIPTPEELVEKLRNPSYSEGLDGHRYLDGANATTMAQAADTIERLTKPVEGTSMAFGSIGGGGGRPRAINQDAIDRRNREEAERRAIEKGLIKP